METLPRTPRTTVRRKPERASYDRAVIEAILDEAIYCHVGVVVDGQPFVIPTIHARLGERLYLHGSPASRTLQTLRHGAPACVTVTLLDGLVLARAARRHSVNYRSVVILGTAREVTEPREKVAALEAVVEHVVPGRWADVRSPSEAELRTTRVVWLPIEEASAKVRTGPPLDDEQDLGWPCWAGVIPVRLTPEVPVPDARAAPLEPPPYLRPHRRG